MWVIKNFMNWLRYLIGYFPSLGSLNSASFLLMQKTNPLSLPDFGLKILVFSVPPATRFISNLIQYSSLLFMIGYIYEVEEWLCTFAAEVEFSFAARR